MRWIVRVYALIPNEWGGYLVMEEYFRGEWLTKFPGGGVEPHEGLIEALSREICEELHTEIEKAHHFYTLDYFQRSYYHKDARLMAIYYKVQLKDAPLVFSPRVKLYWLPPHLMQLTFPGDRQVQKLLMQHDAHLSTEPSSENPPDYPPAPPYS
ncbi:MAG: NUDIX domain-containing protein [Bacteroidia bacterium]|nr:NUDIX domain-containing protein [Bacteroidia bacterium]MDW8235774.1 NUDIX domain-containing protein [Bacteroidia bacterium]